MPRFTQSNTDGYTDDQLDELNMRFESATRDLDEQDYAYKSICDNFAETILANFDAENAQAARTA